MKKGKIKIYNIDDTLRLAEILIRNRHVVKIRQIEDELPFDEGEYEISIIAEGEQE